jgi:sarcosine oxidase subunit gamma
MWTGSAAMVELTSPLAGWGPAFAALPPLVRLAEVAFCEQLNLRLDPAGAAASRVASVLGGPLPTTASTARRYDTRDILWLGPDEWLIVGEPGSTNLEDELRAAIGDEAGGVTDVSAQRTVLTLSGPAAAEVLAHGCAIDLHPQVAPAGTCVQTLLARTGVTIVVRDDSATRFVLLVRASFAQYLAGWLIDAAADLN